MQLHERRLELLVQRGGPRTCLDCLPFSPELNSYEVSDEVLLSPVELRDLGVRISVDLAWKSQIGSIVAK